MGGLGGSHGGLGAFGFLGGYRGLGGRGVRVGADEGVLGGFLGGPGGPMVGNVGGSRGCWGWGWGWELWGHLRRLGEGGAAGRRGLQVPFPRGCRQTLATAVAQLVVAEPGGPGGALGWARRGCGVACLVRDSARRSYFIRLYGLEVSAAGGAGGALGTLGGGGPGGGTLGILGGLWGPGGGSEGPGGESLLGPRVPGVARGGGSRRGGGALVVRDGSGGSGVASGGAWGLWGISGGPGGVPGVSLVVRVVSGMGLWGSRGILGGSQGGSRGCLGGSRGGGDVSRWVPGVAGGTRCRRAAAGRGAAVGAGAAGGDGLRRPRPLLPHLRLPREWAGPRGGRGQK